MGETEIDRMRRLLGELESKQRAQKAAAGACSRPQYRLCVREESPQGLTCRTGRRFTCALAAGEGTAPERELPIPAGAAKALKAGRQSFADVEDFDAYLEDTLEQAAFDKACKMLSSRERPASDARAALMRLGYAERTAQAAVERARRCGLVDDGRYARSFISSKTRAGWGRNRIVAHLEQVGVHLEEAGEPFSEELSEEREYERALAAVSKKRVPETKPVEKLARFLVGRGFSTSLSFKVAKQVVAQSQDSACDSM